MFGLYKVNKQRNKRTRKYEQEKRVNTALGKRGNGRYKKKREIETWVIPPSIHLISKVNTSKKTHQVEVASKSLYKTKRNISKFNRIIANNISEKLAK